MVAVVRVSLTHRLREAAGQGSMVLVVTALDQAVVMVGSTLVKLDLSEPHNQDNTWVGAAVEARVAQ